MTDDHGFQSFSNTLLYGEQINFRALGSISYWDPNTWLWADAASGATVTLYGAIPTDVWINYMLNPGNANGNANYAAQYNYYAGGTVYSADGIGGPQTAAIDELAGMGLSTPTSIGSYLIPHR